MKTSFQIALCQMNVVDNKDINLKKAVSMIDEASVHGAEIVVLPEMFNCPYENDKFVEYAEERETSKTLGLISKAAYNNSVYVVAGSVPELMDGKLYNSSYIFDGSGRIIDVYRKMHLFDIHVEEGISFMESETITPGDKVSVVNTSLIKFGVAICFDLRFPELFRLMVMDGAELIIVPGAFNMTTGPVHWETTIKARAVDNQAYVVAVSPARNHDLTYVAYGHSMIADPWGKILAEADESEMIVYAVVDGNYVKKVRDELPILKNRREDIYELMKKNGK